ncbi:MAG: acetate kinase [Candidatus Omnitrophica bacterium CG_4_8_14_3_um_filter_43_15]|nr:MAG: acetate kinase [Candidatus Omnitrophica bacterium CG03_land_8_20_14_0_80_43_22]PIW80494.1 MAG: acetate kinase [Candidatus Omnitrophica bacterium CG_4_8_14_3_um_filter_43_15]
MLILVINSGSSSIKYQLFDILNGKDKSENKASKEDRKLLCKGLVERIGSEKSSLSHQKEGAEKIKKIVSVANHKEGIKVILDVIASLDNGVIKNISEIAAIGHRVVHGGEEFKSSTPITAEVLKYIEKYCELAPLHNPPALLGIKACKAVMPETPQVAVFDTAFHATMPAHAYLYGLPYQQYKTYKIRRYGFHGTSHKYVAIKAANILDKPIEKLKLITCHLGNGCSITAVENGKSVDTSMGFTPLEGLVMGTRTGDMDPAIVFYLMKKENLDVDQISELLNKKSGLLGLSGVSNDVRDILREMEAGNERAKVAFEVFFYRIKKYIGAYIAAMNGVDAIILTAGIGENNAWIKERICKEMSSLIKGCSAKVLVVPTNEELMIAVDTFEIVKDLK